MEQKDPPLGSGLPQFGQHAPVGAAGALGWGG
jgi:hypothetical protein